MEYKTTYSFYKDCILNFINLSYDFITYFEKSNSDKQIILRHDLDAHLNNALKIAKIESKLGVHSTFFVRLHGRYNPFSYKNKKILLEILNLDHFIGLHSDSDYWNRIDLDFDSLKNNLNHENVLSIYTNHLPSQMKPVYNHGNYFCVDFFRDFHYISDSGGHWNGCFVLDAEKYNKFVLNTHSSWWFKDTPLENY